VEIILHLKTAVISTLFFSLVLLASCFWGRLILKALGIKNNLGYGNPVAVIAFLSILVLLARYLALFSHNMNLFYFCVFVSGTIGFTLELILGIMKNKDLIFTQKNKINEILSEHSIIIVPISISLVMSFCFSFLGITSELEPWLSGNMDYYLWIIMSDYWLGIFDPAKYAISDFAAHLRNMDAFGSDIFFGYFVSSLSKTSFMGSPAYLIAIYSTIGSFIYLIVNRILKLDYRLALLISLFMVLSNFMIYLGICGLFPHLLALFCYLNCVYVVLQNESKTFKEYTISLIPPILLLYLSYQAAFLIFMFLLFCFLCINIYIQKINQDGNPSTTTLFLIKRHILPFGTAIIISILLVPQIFGIFISRSILSLSQGASYGLGLVDPFLFSGIPLYNESLDLQSSNSNIASYLIFAIVLLVIYVVNRRFIRQKNILDEHQIHLKAILYMFIFSIGIYLIVYGIIGDKYQVWKFAAYSILPLSFLPICIFFLCISNIFKAKKYIFIVVIVVSIILILTPAFMSKLSFYNKTKEDPYYQSPLPLFYQIINSNEVVKNHEKIVFDFYTPIENQIALIASETWDKQIYFNKPLLVLPLYPNIFTIFDEKTIFLTKMNFQGIYGGSFDQNLQSIGIIAFDYGSILEKGIVEYTNIDSYTGVINNRDVVLKILIPLKFENLNVKLKIDFSKEYLMDQNCYDIYAYVQDQDEINVQTLDIESFELPILSDVVQQKVVTVIITFPQFNSEYNCFYQIQNVDILPLD
jgi:hypothetical protein